MEISLLQKILNHITLFRKSIYTVIVLLLMTQVALSQRDIIRQGSGRLRQMGGAMSGGGATDSLKRRDKNEDSITIR